MTSEEMICLDSKSQFMSFWGQVKKTHHTAAETACAGGFHENSFLLIFFPPTPVKANLLLAVSNYIH